jgi:hypothetical protein
VQHPGSSVLSSGPNSNQISMPVRLPVHCSILLSFRKLLPAFFWFSTESFSVHQNPEIYLQKRTARLSPAVQVREETPWEGSNSGELSLILFCRSKSPAH